MVGSAPAGKHGPDDRDDRPVVTHQRGEPRLSLSKRPPELILILDKEYNHHEKQTIGHARLDERQSRWHGFGPEKCLMSTNYLTVYIKRDSQWVQYKVPSAGEMTVLGVLDYIYEEIDSSLAYYKSCRIGTCKGCWVEVNGKSALSCRVLAEDSMRIAPLKDRTIIRDLVVDLGCIRQAVSDRRE